MAIRMMQILTGAVALLFAFALYAQADSANLQGTVVDDAGERLPGVTVTLSADEMIPKVTVTTVEGAFRFLDVKPGVYDITAELTGFDTYRKELRVTLKNNPPIDITLHLSTVSEK